MFNRYRRWIPAVVAALLLVVVAVVGRTSGVDDAADEPVVSSTTIPATTTTTTVPKISLSRNLGRGTTGEDVEMVQQRLADIGFDPGPIDGVVGTLTKQAVWAYEKLVMGVPRQDATGVPAK